MDSKRTDTTFPVPVTEKPTCLRKEVDALYRNRPLADPDEILSVSSEAIVSMLRSAASQGYAGVTLNLPLVTTLSMRRGQVLPDGIDNPASIVRLLRDVNGFGVSPEYTCVSPVCEAGQPLRIHAIDVVWGDLPAGEEYNLCRFISEASVMPHILSVIDDTLP